MKGPSLVEVANLREILIAGNDVQGFGFFYTKQTSIQGGNSSFKGKNDAWMCVKCQKLGLG